jgi:hypothetical protein
MDPTWNFTFRDYVRTGTDELGIPTFELCEEPIQWGGTHFSRTKSQIKELVRGGYVRHLRKTQPTVLKTLSARSLLYTYQRVDKPSELKIESSELPVVVLNSEDMVVLCRVRDCIILKLGGIPDQSRLNTAWHRTEFMEVTHNDNEFLFFSAGKHPATYAQWVTFRDRVDRSYQQLSPDEVAFLFSKGLWSKATTIQELDTVRRVIRQHQQERGDK